MSSTNSAVETNRSAAALLHKAQELLEPSDGLVHPDQIALAERFLRKAVEKHPSDAAALDAYAEWLCVHGAEVASSEETARELLQRSISLHPRSEDGKKYLYLAQMSEGYEALELYEEALKHATVYAPGVFSGVAGSCSSSSTPARSSSHVPLNNGPHTSPMDMQSSNTVRKLIAYPSLDKLKTSAATIFVAMSEIMMTDLCDEKNAEPRCKFYLHLAEEAEPFSTEVAVAQATYWKVVASLDKSCAFARKAVALLMRSYGSRLGIGLGDVGGGEGGGGLQLPQNLRGAIESGESTSEAIGAISMVSGGESMEEVVQLPTGKKSSAASTCSEAEILEAFCGRLLGSGGSDVRGAGCSEAGGGGDLEDVEMGGMAGEGEGAGGGEIVEENTNNGEGLNEVEEQVPAEIQIKLVTTLIDLRMFEEGEQVLANLLQEDEEDIQCWYDFDLLIFVCAASCSLYFSRTKKYSSLQPHRIDPHHHQSTNGDQVSAESAERVKPRLGRRVGDVRIRHRPRFPGPGRSANVAAKSGATEEPPPETRARNRPRYRQAVRRLYTPSDSSNELIDHSYKHLEALHIEEQFPSSRTRHLAQKSVIDVLPDTNWIQR